MFSYTDCETTHIEGKRIYLIDDERMYPSITTVLGQTDSEKKSYLEAWKARVGQKKAKEVSENAAERGTNVHLMLERQLRGEDPRLHEFPEAHANIFRSLRLEVKKINKVFGQEVVLYSDVLGVAGRCDLVAEYQNTLAIVDYKTSTWFKDKSEIGDYWLQAAFYATAHNEMFGTKIDRLIIMMGVENRMPLVFKRTMDDELLIQLCERVSEFYSNL